MSIRARKRRRIAILIAIAALLAVGGFVASKVQQSRRDARALAARETGRAAYAEGNYVEALHGLGEYLGRYGENPDSAEDWFQYSMARREVPQENRRHVVTAIGSLRKAIQRDANHLPARRELIKLYFFMNFETEAMAEAEALLEIAPTDAQGLHAKRAILTRSQRYEEALAVSLRANELAPDDLGGHFATLSIMMTVGKSRDEVVTWAEALHLARPEDRAMMLVKAAAYRSFGERMEASACLDRALEGEPLDAVFARALVWELDRLERFGDALRVLETLPFADQPADLRRDLIKRLWFVRRQEDVVRFVESIGDEALEDDPWLLGLYAISLRQVGRDEDGRVAARRMSRRSSDNSVEAWALFLDGVVFEDSPHHTHQAEVCMKALAADPENPLILHALGNAQLGLGEDELAIDAWARAARAAQTWGSPFARIAGVCLRTGREHLALTPAKRAYLLSPNDREALLMWVQALVRNSGLLSEERSAQLLEDLDRLQTQNPEEERLLPVYVALLAERSPEQAKRRLTRILESETPPKERTLLRLASAIEDSELGLELACFELSERAHGVTPSLAFARASHLARSGKEDEGLETLRTALQRSEPSKEWTLAWVRYLDLIDHADAPATWSELGDAHPEELDVQLAALASRRAWEARDGMERTITRTKRLTGESGLTWRVAQARWLLLDSANRKPNAQNAADLLDEVVELAPRSLPVRLLLATARERLGDLGGAVEQLRVAASLAPEEGSLTLELARLAQERGDITAARSSLDRFLRRDLSSPQEVQQVVSLLFRQGDVHRALGLIESVRKDRRLSRAETVMLVRLHARLGHLERATRICEQLLEEPDATSIGLAASMYALRDRKDDAEAVLARLEELDLPAADRHRIRADYYSSSGDPKQAMAEFRAALEADRDQPEIWAALLAHCVRTGDVGAAETSIGEAGSVSDDSNVVSVVQSNSAAFLKALPDVELRPLLLALLLDPDSRDSILEVLQLLLDQPDRENLEAGVLRRVQLLAEKNPRVLPLQMVSVDLLVRAKQYGEALRVAAKATDTFPHASAPAERAAQLYAMHGRWQQAMEAGVEWRSRQTRKSRRADLLIAEVLIRLNRAEDALVELEPHLKDARRRPAENERLLMAYSWSLLLAKRHTEAADLLLPLAATNERWRRLWMSLDVHALSSDPTTAERWLNVAAQIIPADDGPGALAIARGWHSSWRKSQDKRHFATAERLYRRLAEAGDAKATEDLGVLYHESGRPDEAVTTYLKALELDESLRTSRNNAAMLLARKGDARALKLAQSLCEAVPGDAEYQDTLAFCLDKAGRHADAAACFRRALELNTKEPRWHIGLAEQLQRAGKPKEAATALGGLEELRAAGAAIPSGVRERIDALRRALPE